KQSFRARGFDRFGDDLPEWSSAEHPKYSAGEIITHKNSALHTSDNTPKKSVRLGHVEFIVVENNPEQKQFEDEIVKWFEAYALHPYMPEGIFQKRLALISNEAFTYQTRYATEKVQGNALDY